jgi:hypothetical protein
MAKFTAKEIKEQTKKIQDVIAKHKRESKDEHFASLTPEEIEAKLKRVNSPMFTSSSWSDPPLGGTFSYGVNIYNPDPISPSNLYVHVWVGSGNVDPSIGTFLLNVDTRFTRLTQPPAFGLTLAPSANTILSFSIKVPATVEKTVYIGNSCLMQLKYNDVGTYLDRGSFPFNVT